MEYAVIAAGLQIHQHAAAACELQLFYHGSGHGGTGVGTRSAYLADKAAVGALVQSDRSSQQSGGRVVEDDYFLAVYAAAAQLLIQ